MTSKKDKRLVNVVSKDLQKYEKIDEEESVEHNISKNQTTVAYGQPSDSFYEGLVSCFGGLLGVLGSYVCCCCNPYTTVVQGHELVVTRFGRYKETLPPGYHYMRPITDKGYDVSMMTHVIDLPGQTVLSNAPTLLVHRRYKFFRIYISRDTVTAHIDGSVYYKVTDSYTATFTITGRDSCLNQLALSALRACFANHTLQESLENRNVLAREIKEYMDFHSRNWGIEVAHIVIKDITLSKEMQRHLSARASAEREAQAKVIDARGDVEAAKLLREAADTLNSPAALQIRHLENLKAMASNPGTKIIFVPMQMDNLVSTAAAIEGMK